MLRGVRPEVGWATASSDGTARVFDAVSGAEQARLPHDGPVWSVVFILRSTVSVDEELLAAARQRAWLRGQTLGQLVEGSLRRELAATGDTDDR